MSDPTQTIDPAAKLAAISYIESITDAIGGTPLVRLRSVPQAHGVKCTMLAKLEFLNPAASVKDRMAVWVIEDAIKNGELKPGGTIIEATSGNTGAAVAMYAAAHGYKAILTAPDKTSAEKVDTLKAFGAEIIICKTDVPADDPDNYYQVAKALHAKTENSFFLEQYQNTKNIDAHYYTTGPEIWNQTDGKMTCFVGGIGTGGTVSGCARYFKEQDSNLEVVAADPYGSIYFQYHKDGTVIEPDTYLVEGIGEDMVCQSIDMSVIDKIYQVNDQECFDHARELARTEGILAGGSSGAALSVALKHAQSLPGSAIMVILFPDSGLKYMSKLYSDDWMRNKGLNI